MQASCRSDMIARVQESHPIPWPGWRRLVEVPVGAGAAPFAMAFFADRYSSSACVALP